MRYLEPNWDIREKHQYNNIMFILAAYLVECITGEIWEDFLKRRVLKELDMNNTYTSLYRSRQTGNFCEYCEDFYGEPVLCSCEFPADNDPDEISVGAPAGCINTDLEDIAKWLSLHMNKGKYKDKQIISEETLNELFKPAMVDFWGRDDFTNEAVCLGWFSCNYRGVELILHGGYWSSHIYLLPKYQIGIAVFGTKQEGNFLTDVIAKHVIERMTGLEQRDNNKPFVERRRKVLKEAIVERDKRLTALKDKKYPEHDRPFSGYAGTYKHPAYGDYTFEVNEAGKLSCERLNRWGHKLEYAGNDSFTAIFVEREGDESDEFAFTFHKNESGTFQTVSAPLEPTVKDIIFRKEG